MKTLTHCPLCGSGALSRVPFEYWYQFERYPAARCGACGLVFLSAQPDRDTLSEMYDADYFESDFRCGSEPAAGLGGEHSERVFAEEARASLELIRKLTGRTAGRILEIGCAGGWFLKAAREQGWEGRGIEISGEAAEFAGTKLGLDVFCGELAEAGFPSGSFDVVYMADVLEHVPEPVAFMREVNTVLARGGQVVVCGPTALNALSRRIGLAAYALFGRTRSIALAPYHLFEYTPGTLRLLLEKGGFEVVTLEKHKIRPSLRSFGPEELAMFALELINWPATALFGAWGDRVILCARAR
jgi:SAM-dependent methyltransferase